MAITKFEENGKIIKEKTGEEFDTLYKKYYDKLSFFTSNICSDQQSGEDLATNAFIQAVNKIDTFDNTKSQFSTWLFTIARNMSLQHVKKSKKTISMDMEFDTDGTTMKDFLVHGDSDVNIIEKSHLVTIKKANIMKQKMKELKEPYRTVIDMREIQQMPYQQIADVLDRNLSTVKSQIRNARLILQREVRDEFERLDKELY